MSNYDIRDMGISDIRREFDSEYKEYESCPDALFEALKEKYDCIDEELIHILSEKAQEICQNNGFEILYNCMAAIPGIKSNDMKESLREDIGEIDKVIVDNFEKIRESYFSYKQFEFSVFSNMPKFKEEIKKVGPDFFIKFPLRYYEFSLDECKQIAKDIFGEITSENITKMKFGQNNENRASIIQMVIDELIKYSNEKASVKMTMEDVEQIGERCVFRSLGNRKLCFENWKYERGYLCP